MSQEYANMADDKKKEGRTPRDIMRVVFRRKRLFVLAAAAVAFGGLVAAHWMPLEYTGKTTFMLRSDSAAGSARSRGNESLEQAKLTLRYDLLDRSALEAVIYELGLDRGLPLNSSNKELTREGQQAMQKLVVSLGEKASLSWDVQSPGVDRLTLSFTDANANMAAEIPNALAKHYFERTSKRITDQLTVSRDFLKKQVEDYETHLGNLDNERIAFEKEHAAVMPESAGAAQSKIDGLKADLTRMSREKIKARNKIDDARRRIIQLNTMFPDAIGQLKKGWPEETKDEVDRILGLKLTTTQSTSKPAIQPGGEILAATTTQSTSQPATQSAGVLLATTTSQPATKPAEEPVQIAKGPNPDFLRLEAMLRQAKDELYTMQSIRHMKDAHPQVQALKERIVELEKDLKATPAEKVLHSIYNTAAGMATQEPTVRPTSDPLGLFAMSGVMAEYRTAMQEWELLQGEYTTLDAKYNESAKLMANFHAVRKRYEELRDKMAKVQNDLNARQAQLNEIQMALAGEVAKKRTHMTTVQAAQVELLPSSPKLIRTIGGVFALAIACGTALVFLWNFFDRTISTTDKASEFFDLPVHGVIGEIVSKKQFRWRRFRGWVLTPTVMVVILGCIALAVMSIVLKLQFPEGYTQWKTDPLAFVYDKGRVAAEKIVETLKAL